MYDEREKAQRDHQWALAGAREEGHQEGRIEGRQEGRIEGRQEGILTGRIQLMQELLGEPVTADEQLLQQDRTSLESQLRALQSRFRVR